MNKRIVSLLKSTFDPGDQLAEQFPLEGFAPDSGAANCGVAMADYILAGLAQGPRPVQVQAIILELTVETLQDSVLQCY